jgi:hypothetical protein
MNTEDWDRAVSNFMVLLSKKIFDIHLNIHKLINHRARGMVAMG